MTEVHRETGRLDCPCTETWQEIPGCGETRYAYGFWVHPECPIHWGGFQVSLDMFRRMAED